MIQIEINNDRKKNFCFLALGMEESNEYSSFYWSFFQFICFSLECFLIKDQIVLAWNKQLEKGNLPSPFLNKECLYVGSHAIIAL